MTSQSPRIYTYKITFVEVPYFYYGSKKEKYYNQPYMGSPIANKWCWELYSAKKQILEIFPYTDEGYEECRKIEDRLIKPFLNDPWCLNSHCGGRYSIEACRKGGRKGGKIVGPKTLELGIGVHGLDEKRRIENARKAGLVGGKRGGKIGGKRAYELGVGIHGKTKEQRSEDGKKGGYKTYELGIGVHGLTPEEIKEAAKKGGQKTKEEKLGIFAMTPEERSEASRKAGLVSGKKHKENGTGIFSMTAEQRSEIGKRNGKKVFEQKLGCFSLTPEERVEVSKKVGNKAKEEKLGIFAMTAEEKSERSRKVGLQKWRCLITGHIANSGNLSQYQKKLGIDTSLRERLE